jgi:HTH-type transcriptional regulator/antitoxin HipB
MLQLWPNGREKGNTCFPTHFRLRGFQVAWVEAESEVPMSSNALDSAHSPSESLAAREQVIRAPSQLAQLLIALRRQRRLSQAALAQKAGGLSQARLSALELHPGRFTLERLLLILAALDLELVVRPRRPGPEPAEW